MPQASNRTKPCQLLASRRHCRLSHSMTACAACSWQVWDTRSMAVGGAVEAAHSSPVRDMDLSRHHQHLAVSGGDDGRVFMWDLRCGPSWDF